MKKIIPFKKKLTFNTNVSEVTSIALENTLHNDNNIVDGDLIINGSYKITDTSIKTDDFEFKIPVNIEIDDKYITDNIIIDIDDFYYEIINSNILEVNIDILLDNLVEKPMIEQVREDEDLFSLFEEEEKVEDDKVILDSLEVRQDNILEPISEEISGERCIEEETIVTNVKEDVKTREDVSIFSGFSAESEEYSTYCVYIVREGDTLDSILMKYELTTEKLMEYNDISELKLGDKLIIPEVNV